MAYNEKEIIPDLSIGPNRACDYWMHLLNINDNNYAIKPESINNYVWLGIVG